MWIDEVEAGRKVLRDSEPEGNVIFTIYGLLFPLSEHQPVMKNCFGVGGNC